MIQSNNTRSLENTSDYRRLLFSCYCWKLSSHSPFSFTFKRSTARYPWRRTAYKRGTERSPQRIKTNPRASNKNTNMVARTSLWAAGTPCQVWAKGTLYQAWLVQLLARRFILRRRFQDLPWREFPRSIQGSMDRSLLQLHQIRRAIYLRHPLYR